MKNHLPIIAHQMLPDIAAMAKHRRNEGLGRRVSTGNFVTPTFCNSVSTTPTPASMTVKRQCDEELGECISSTASTTPNHTVPSTSYRCLPGSSIILKTAVLGFAISSKAISSTDTPSSRKLEPAEVTSQELNNLDPSHWRKAHGSDLA